MEPEKKILKVQLADKLLRDRVFWSYADVKSSDISAGFSLFSY
jgi:hypothetical protein